MAMKTAKKSDGRPGTGRLNAMPAAISLLAVLCLALVLWGCEHNLEAVILSPGAYQVEITEGEIVSFEGVAIGGIPFTRLAQGEAAATGGSYWFSWNTGNVPANEDQSTASENVKVTFDEPGVYTVSLTVTDSQRNTDTAYVTVIVKEKAAADPLKALILAPAGTSASVVRCNTLTFKGTGLDGEPFTGEDGNLDEEPYGYFWNVAGLPGVVIPTGESVISSTINVTFEQADVHTVVFSVTDSRGVTATASVRVTVLPTTADQELEAGEEPASCDAVSGN